ncbi:hypothetical protein KUTeg_023632 [Tegillarca granosa]|uniref:Uncharacterized protein n=1 Tax=Tegillarca granosa TaxID=220873 RepID=A0ABQ9E2R4_TEGGR|nr:hypothetical protein KUTeg_023632 [Tegillarca granosa]
MISTISLTVATKRTKFERLGTAAGHTVMKEQNSNTSNQSLHSKNNSMASLPSLLLEKWTMDLTKWIRTLDGPHNMDKDYGWTSQHKWTMNPTALDHRWTTQLDKDYQ